MSWRIRTELLRRYSHIDKKTWKGGRNGRLAIAKSWESLLIVTGE
jgi:hypothetical protein